MVIRCEKCGRDLENGLCIGCGDTPQRCTCEEKEEEEE